MSSKKLKAEIRRVDGMKSTPRIRFQAKGGVKAPEIYNHPSPGGHGWVGMCGFKKSDAAVVKQAEDLIHYGPGGFFKDAIVQAYPVIGIHILELYDSLGIQDENGWYGQDMVSLP
jgi:hypothetical protein